MQKAPAIMKPLLHVRRQIRKRKSGWLKGYVLFRALKEFYKWQTWTAWPEDLKNFVPSAVHAFHTQYREYVDFFAYVQWVLDLQLRRTKTFAQEQGVLIFGDIPFGTNLDSAEVWSERENYRLGYEIGGEMLFEQVFVFERIMVLRERHRA